MGKEDQERGKNLAAEDIIPALPLGFSFNPSEEQLLSHYLKRKINGIEDELEVIPEVDLYKCEPWDLPDKSFLPRSDKQWFFFSPCDRKYPNGSLTNRATEAGYWKTTGRDCKVRCRPISGGVKKTLVFYKGRPPRGERTEWLMHEYRLDENECEAGAGQNAFVLCHVLKTSGAKIGAQHSARIQKCDSSPKNESPSDFPSENEEPSEGKSKGVEENRTNSSLPNMTDDGTRLDWYLGLLLDEPDSKSLSLAPDEDTITTQVDAMPKDCRSQCESESVWPLNADDFPQVPDDLFVGQTEDMDAYYEEAGIVEEILRAVSQDYDDSGADHYYPEDAFANILSGDYIELDDLNNNDTFISDHNLNGDYIELDDLNNNDTSISDHNLLHHEVTGIQLRPRSPTLQNYQQGFSSEGTSRRIHLQLYKIEASAVTHQTSNYCAYAESDSIYDPKVQQLLLGGFGQQQCNSEIITQNEISTAGVFPPPAVDQKDELSGTQSYDMLDPAYFNSAADSSDVSRRNLVSHRLTPMPPAISVTEQTCDSKMSEHACFHVYALASDELPTAEYVEKAVGSISENPIEVSTRGARLDENSIAGKSVADSESKSSELGPERRTSEPNTSETESLSSPNIDSKSSKVVSKILSCIPANPASAMESTAALSSSNYIMGARVATDLNSVYLATARVHDTTSTINIMGSKGGVELPGSDMVSSGLRHRAILEPNDRLSGDKDKMKGLVREPVDISTDTNVGSVHPRYSSTSFSWLGKRISLRRSNGSFLVTCLKVTAFLFFCFMLSRIIWLFARTFSTIAF